MTKIKARSYCICKFQNVKIGANFRFDRKIWIKMTERMCEQLLYIDKVVKAMKPDCIVWFPETNREKTLKPIK